MDITKKKLPYQQGDLDMLCGVYSLLNIIQLLSPKSKTKSRKLYVKVLRHLEKTKHSNLSKVVGSGLTFKDMKQLFNVFLTAEGLYWELPFNGGEDLDQYWDVLSSLLNCHHESCIFINITGIHNHWTIVKNITVNTMTLFDSDGLSRLNRRNCCIQDIENDKAHVLWPKNTVFIYKTKQY